MRGELLDARMRRFRAEQARRRRIKQEQEAAAGLPAREPFKQFP